MSDFFISFNQADKAWAEWIAWQLDAAGYSVTFQHWDFRPGRNFVVQTNDETEAAGSMIAVLSPDYPGPFSRQELAAALRRDPEGKERRLLPVRVRDCELPSLVAPICYVDLVGADEEEARRRLLDGLKPSGKPDQPPRFPGAKPAFPAAAPADRPAEAARRPDEPRASLWVHGWAKSSFDPPPTVELDWTAHFDRASRRLPDQKTWEEVLLPGLEAARRRLAALPHGTFLDFRGLVPLTAALAIGWAFPQVAGFRFRTLQSTESGPCHWRSDAEPSGLELKSADLSAELAPATRLDGRDVLVGLGLTGDAREEVRQLARELSSELAAAVYAEPATPPGESALSGDRDACALASAAKALLREVYQRHRPRRIHLVPFSPVSFCLFLGQRLNAVGEVATYERRMGGGYQESVVLRTG